MKCRTTKKSRRVLTFSFTAFLLALLTANELYVNERRLLNDKINLKYRTFDEDSVSDAVTHVATPKLHSSDLDSSPSEPLLPDIEPKTATQPKRPVEEKHNHSSYSTKNLWVTWFDYNSPHLNRTWNHSQHVPVVLLAPTSPRRPNKVVVVPAEGIIYVPIWKAMSTSVTKYLNHEYPGSAFGPHETKDSLIYNGSSPSHVKGPCTDDVVVQPLLQDATKIFTVVRDPLTRFISATKPHGEFPLCGNGTIVCEEETRRITDQLFRIKRTNGLSVSDEHLLPQMYFLSSTDRRGNLLRFTHLYRMELVGDLFLAGENASDITSFWFNNKSSIELYIAHFQQDYAFQRALCEIYYTDYKCLGYKLPTACHDLVTVLDFNQWLNGQWLAKEACHHLVGL